MFGGLLIRGMFSAGAESFGGSRSPGAAVPLSSQANQMYSFSAEFDAGPLTAGIGLQEVRLVATTDAASTAPAAFTGGLATRRDSIIGVKRNFGPLWLGGGYQQMDPAGAANNRQAWTGGTARAGAGTVVLQVNRLRQNFAPNPAGVRRSAGIADTTSIRYTHPPPRRTTG